MTVRCSTVLSHSQKAWLGYVNSYAWVKEGASKNDLFERVDSPEVLFYLSLVVEWDHLEGDFETIIRHSLCDRGLALLIYWSSEPQKLLLQDPTVLTPHDAAVYRLCREIERKIQHREFLEGHIAFVPQAWREDHGIVNVGCVPDFMLKPTPGATLNLNYPEVIFS